MKKLLEQLQGSKYRVTIADMSGKMPASFSYTHAPSEDSAISKVVWKIVREVQRIGSPYSKSWVYTDGKFKAPVAPNYARLLIEYLIVNPRLVKVEKLLGEGVATMANRSTLLSQLKMVSRDKGVDLVRFRLWTLDDDDIRKLIWKIGHNVL